MFTWPATAATTLGSAISVAPALFGVTMPMVAAAAALRTERPGLTTLCALTCIIAGWTIIASLVCAPTTAV